MRDLLALVVLASSMIVPRPADACSPVDPYFIHEVDAAHVGDTTPPGPVTAGADVYYDRGGGGGGCAPQCGGYGTRIVLAPSASDDRTPNDRIGYRLKVVGGTPPADLALPVGDVEPLYGDISLTFRDTSRFAFALEITAVDLNNNLGPPTVIAIASDGRPDDGGCTAGSTAPPTSAGLLVLALCGLVRRRRWAR